MQYARDYKLQHIGQSGRINLTEQADGEAVTQDTPAHYFRPGESFPIRRDSGQTIWIWADPPQKYVLTEG